MYDHFIALDWAQSNMAIARLTPDSKTPKVVDVPADLRELKSYLDRLRGRKILTFEETTTSHWLYVELKELVDSIIICDPYRNKLLSEGAKNDKIDAIKLVQLLKADMLKPVFHSCDEIIKLRKIISSYDDLIKRGVRLKNQKSAVYRAIGLTVDAPLPESASAEKFILLSINSAIDQYEEQRKLYEKEFEEQKKKFTLIRYLSTIPGIGLIGSVKIAAIVVDGKRFPSEGHFHSYCGLVRHDKMSGGRSYGTRQSRHRPDLKAVFKTAALAVISHTNEFKGYYKYLVESLRYSDHNARHAVARKIATAAYAVMKHKKRYNQLKLGATRHFQK